MKRTAEDYPIESETDYHKAQKQDINSDAATATATATAVAAIAHATVAIADADAAIAHVDASIADVAIKLSNPTETQEIDDAATAILEKALDDCDEQGCERCCDMSIMIELKPVVADRTEAQWKEYDENVFVEWLFDFDERILTYQSGEPMNWGWGGNTIQESGYIPLFGTGRSRKYYEKYPEKEDEDKALCQNICPLSVFHGFVELFESRPNVCYGSYEMQIFCHVLKSLLIRFQRSIPEFLKRLLSIYDEAEYICARRYDSYRKSVDTKNVDKLTKSRLNETPKHLQIMIAIFLTENFTFLTTREIGDSKASPPTNQTLPSIRVTDIKDPKNFSAVVISNLFPTKSIWNYPLDNNHKVDKYLDLCLAEWRKYMYAGTVETFVIKPLKAETKEAIKLVSYY